jgi:uncharacterized protein YwqG
MFSSSVFELTVDDLLDRCRQAGFGRFKEEIRRLILPSINLHPDVCQDDIELGSSKIGGRADLRQGVEWPQTDDGWPLSFLGQINLAHAADFDVNQDLPPQGLLSFFYDAQRTPWGFDPADRGKWKVFYEPEDVGPAQLQRASFPDSLPAECRFDCAAVGFRKLLTLPHPDTIAMQQLGLTSDEFFKFWDFCLKASPPGDRERTAVLGNPSIIQCEMQRECQMASNGIYWGDQSCAADPRVSELDAGSTQWRLLFQLPSLQELGMCWEDGGFLYYMILETDLADRNFRNAWLLLRCT